MLGTAQGATKKRRNSDSVINCLFVVNKQDYSTSYDRGCARSVIKVLWNGDDWGWVILPDK